MKTLYIEKATMQRERGILIPIPKASAESAGK
jgi:hypothetical protein